ncbi:MAG: ClC family H(+)/Cl(-) exchange transporter [Clostridia bacterium]
MVRKIHNNYKAIINTDSKKLPILYKSILIGLFVGIVTTLYRLVLMEAEELSFRIYGYLRDNLIFIPIAFIVLGVTGFLIGSLVSKYSMISGSGIPQVKGIIMGYFKNNWLGTLIVKFFGGTVSILAGLSLGREGPSIQLGACAAEGLGNKLAASRTERKVLIASGAGAGLAAAFNAPLAGAMFAMEEIFKYFSPVILLSTMVSAVIADFVSKMVFGNNPVFSFNMQNNIPLNDYWLLIILGATLGVIGAFYNFILIQTQKLYKKSKWLNVKTRPIIPFMLAGVLGLFFPLVLGGGHKIIDELQLTTGITFLLLIFVIKFMFSMISFGSGAPGGIFFPLLILGATVGAIYGNIAVNYFGYDANLFYNFVILAMVGYFTAIVRAPITGIILLVEMTGSFTHLLSLTVVSIIAYIVADLLKSHPIYESLLETRILEHEIEIEEHDHSKKITIETIVHYGSSAENKLVKEIDLPSRCLLIAIKRRRKEIIPKGDTKILAEDYLVCLTNVSDEAKIRETLADITTAS